MATYHNGILGAFTGTIGSVVGSSWNGIPVIRKRPAKSTKEPSVLQKAQRARFSLVAKFLSPLSDLLNQTYAGPGKTGFNRALSESMIAVAGSYPDFKMNYARVLLTGRMLPLGEPPSMSSPEPGKLQVNWNIGDGINRRLTTGFVFVAAYNEELNRWIYHQFVINEYHMQCSAEMMPFVSKPVHVYLGFISWDRKKVSESRYMGQINVLS